MLSFYPFRVAWFSIFLGCMIWFSHHFFGKWLGNRQIRCNWAAKGAGTNEDKQINDSQNAVVLTNGSSGSMQPST